MIAVSQLLRKKKSPEELGSSERIQIISDLLTTLWSLVKPAGEMAGMLHVSTQSRSSSQRATVKIRGAVGRSFKRSRLLPWLFVGVRETVCMFPLDFTQRHVGELK